MTDSVPRETRGGPIEQAGDVALRVFEGWEEAQCGACGEVFQRRKGGVDTCGDCQRKARDRERIEGQAAGILARRDDYVREVLKRAGMSPRELKAEESRIPEKLRALLWGQPARGVATLLAGRVPEMGFGISGGAGVGKTFALAVLMRAMAEAKLTRDVQAYGAKGLQRSWLGWVSWPEAVNEFRVVSTRETGIDEVHRQVVAMAELPVLVLDDLGAERMRGNYEDDWAAQQLELLVDTRYNEERRTWWTSNLTPAELLSRYGARLFSRLTSENPAVLWNGPDLRRVK